MEVSRVLKVGGILNLAVPDAEAFLNLGWLQKITGKTGTEMMMKQLMTNIGLVLMSIHIKIGGDI